MGSSSPDQRALEPSLGRLVIGPYFYLTLPSFFKDRLTDTLSRKGGPLAVTDANLLLGRLIPDYFPKIFGKSEKEPLDVEASRVAFEKVAKEINDNHPELVLSLDEIVYGFVFSSTPCSTHPKYHP